MEDHHIRRRIIVHSVEEAGYILAYECVSEASVTSCQRKRLYFMEKKMMKLFRDDSFLRSKKTESLTQLLIDKLVAVRAVSDSSKENWARGFVLENKRNSTNVHLEIQLIDYCCHYLYPLEDVRPLPSEFDTSVLECQSMKIVLYGVEPAFLNINLSGENKLVGSKKFCGKDVRFIDEQIEEAQSVYFEERCRMEEFYFGDIILKQNDGSLLNLKDLLVKFYYAIEIPNFECNIPMYIKNFRHCTSAFDHNLAVRKMLFPSISFSDEQQSTNRNDTDYYYNHPVDTELTGCVESNMLNRSNSNHLQESTSSSTSEVTLPAASLTDTEQSLDECSDFVDKILVLTGDPTKRFHAVSSFTESPLDSETLQMLKRLRLRDMTHCQKYIIPAVLTGQNVTVISGSETGKTVGVLISLVSLMRRSSKGKKPGLGARAIVVCPYSADCEMVQKKCLQIIQGRLDVSDSSCDAVSVNVAYGLGNELEAKNLIELLKGYDILACTPRRLLRLLENENAFNFSRLAHIVFDNMNTLLKSYGDEMKEIFQHVRRKQKLPQRIIICDQWMPQLKVFVKEDIEHKRGSLLIPSYLDAAFFVRLKSIWTFTSDECNKVKSIIEMLNGVLEFRNVVVVFSDEDDIDSVYDMVRYECPRQIYLVQDFKRLNAIDIVKDWQNDVTKRRCPVLLCTDYVLRDQKIYEADYLIHYSLPQSKTEFLFRFSVLLNRLQTVADEIIKPFQRPMHPRRRPEMYIFSNEENYVQFPEMVKIMQQLGAELPDRIKLQGQNILRRKELLKRESGFCPNLKEFGRCHRESRCKYRHIILQDDIPDKTLPSNGYIKALIMYVYSATHYGIRILERATESTGPWLPVEGLPRPDSIFRKLVQHFCEEKNRKMCAHFEIGDIVAFEKNNSFHRVRILKFRQADASEEDEKRKTPKRALVKFIDEGREEEISTTTLMELPTSLASIPPGIVDVFICNLLPIDEDVAWGDQITRIVRSKLMSLQNTDGCYFTGKIELVLGRSLWLDSLTGLEKKASFENPIPRFSVSRMLLKQLLANRHEKHLPLLLRMCEEADLKKIDAHDGSGPSEKNVLNRNIKNRPTNDDEPSKENKDTDVETIHSVSHSRSEKNMLDRNVVNDRPTNDDKPSKENKGAGIETVHSSVSHARSKKHVLFGNVDVHDISSHNDILSTKDKDAGILKPQPISISRLRNNVSKKIVDNNIPSSTSNNVPSNEARVFKKPDSAVLKNGINESSSVPTVTLKPQVEWRQNSTHVILSVAVNSDPNNFRVEVTKENRRRSRLYFCAWMDQKYYEFCESLYLSVRIPMVESYKSGVFICIKMKKLLTGISWERLFHKKTPYRWVRMDQSFLNFSDKDSDEEAYVAAPHLQRDVGKVDRDSGSDSDSADDSDSNEGYDFCN